MLPEVALQLTSVPGIIGQVPTELPDCARQVAEQSPPSWIATVLGAMFAFTAQSARVYVPSHVAVQAKNVSCAMAKDVDASPQASKSPPSKPLVVALVLS